MNSPSSQSIVELSSINRNSMDNQEQINSIDTEISELEELITLQRLKVDLLRKKNEMLKSGTAPSTSASARAKPHPIVNPLQKPQEDDQFQNGDQPSPKEEPSTNSAKQLTSSVKQLALIDSMQRLSRLSTDLANERNLLAWGRTAMAAARTALAFLGLVGNNAFGTGLVYTTSIGFGIVSVWMMLQGGVRYRQIKKILLLPNPPLHFGRISNVPVNVVLLALLVLLVIGNSADSWTK